MLFRSPTYQFAGLNTQTGYVDYSQTGGESVRINYPSVTGIEPIDTNTISNVTYQGQPAYSIQLVNAALGTVADRYSQYEAELLNVSGTVVGSFRILAHTERTLLLDAADGPLPG